MPKVTAPGVADFNGDGRLDLAGLVDGLPVSLISHGTKNYRWQVIRTRAANAQGDQRNVVEPSYDVILQVLIGGDAKAAGQPLPQGLNAVAKQLRGNYSFADYRLANTYIGRIANGGNFEFKSISNLFGINPDFSARSICENHD